MRYSCIAGSLDRTAVDFLVVQMIMKHPDSADLLFKAVDSLDIDDIQSTIMDSANEIEGDILLLINMLQPYIERINNLRLCKRTELSLDLLLVISQMFIVRLIEYIQEESMFEEGSKERDEIDLFVRTLEKQWVDVVAAHSAATLESLQENFKTLAEWRLNLTKSMGPIFSDALRLLKTKIVAKTAASDSTTSVAMGTNATKKQKVESS
jgi:hypothetical protein